ncbi:MAG: PIG-L deacetylase family protein [Syntrophobacteraceae bacterium]
MRHTIAVVFISLIALILGSSTSCADDISGKCELIKGLQFRHSGPSASEQNLVLAYELGAARSPDVIIPSYQAVSNKELRVPNRLRLMVFSPHPDDETLSSAGLIQRVLAKGGQVRIVFVTNGDGYLDGIRCELDRNDATIQDFIEYGKKRHEEALHALVELGLQHGDGIFLGFPDDGIDDLLGGHWSRIKPFISPYTNFDHPHYKESFSRWVKYAASDLVDEISRIMVDFNPDWVILPDPRDKHPDHNSTGVFVLEALRKLRRNGDPSFVNVQAFTYLVHYPDYPASTKWLDQINLTGICGSPAACKVLAEAQWSTLPITSEELAVKRNALAAHQTQFEPLHDLLKRFLVRYELFCHMEPFQIMTVPVEYTAWFGIKDHLTR